MASQDSKHISRMTGTNHLAIGKDDVRKYDCYSTPKIAVDELLKREEFSRRIWEPANGLHRISAVLEQRGFEVFASDIKRWHDYTDCQRNFNNFTSTP